MDNGLFIYWGGILIILLLVPLIDRWNVFLDYIGDRRERAFNRYVQNLYIDIIHEMDRKSYEDYGAMVINFDVLSRKHNSYGFINKIELNKDELERAKKSTLKMVKRFFVDVSELNSAKEEEYIVLFQPGFRYYANLFNIWEK